MKYLEIHFCRQCYVQKNKNKNNNILLCILTTYIYIKYSTNRHKMCVQLRI